MTHSRKNNPSHGKASVSLQQQHKMYFDLLKKNPNNAEALIFLGKHEVKAGRVANATPFFRRAYELDKQSVAPGLDYALVLCAQNRKLEAIEILEKVAAMHVDRLDIAYLLANVLKDHGIETKSDSFVEKAIEIYANITRQHQDHPGALNNFGISLLYLRKIKEAECCFARAISLDESNPLFYNNLSITARLQHLAEHSVHCCRKAIQLRPDYPEAHNNLGNALKDLNDLPAAIEAYRRAVSLKPDPDYRCNLAMALLATGDFKTGWEMYESRKASYALRGSQPGLAQPQWLGEEAQGKTLLIHSEQGLGDTIQFCRYACMAEAKGLRVLLQVQRPLLRLVQSLSGNIRVVADVQHETFDLQCPMMSLPLAFHTDIDSIPSAKAYLFAPEEKIRFWKDMLAGISQYKVGIVWSGQTMRHSSDLEFTNKQRSMPAEFFEQLQDRNDVCLFSLQKEGPKAPDSLKAVDHMDQCEDFADTAALVMNLDLVVTVDTAVAHLAGALGKPVWVLNRFSGCWRWLRGRKDSPWYPTLRLFTQTAPGDWQGVIAEVKEALAREIASQRTPGRPDGDATGRARKRCGRPG